MGDENQPGAAADIKNKDTELADVERRAAEDRRLNAAVKDHVQRAIKPLLDEIKQLRAGQRPADGSPGTGGVSEAARLAEENAALRRDATEAKQRAAREKTNRALLSALGEKGIHGARAEALVSLWRERGDLVDGDDGARFSVTRPRATTNELGAPKEISRIDHDDLALAVADWAASDGAREFLPAPMTGARPGGNRPRQMAPRAPMAPRNHRDLDGMLNDTLDQLRPETRDSLTRPDRGEPALRKTIDDLAKRGLKF